MEPEQAKEVVPEEQPKLLPNDALVVMAILEEQNIPEYEPRVVHQLLDFTYSYVTQIVSDAKAYADHARKPTLDLDDIKLAADMVMERSFTEPPQRHELAEATEQCNSVPLPRVKRKNGLRLPPSAHCLIGRNYRLRKPPSIKATEAALESRKAKSVRKESSQLTKQQAKEQLNETPTDDLKVGDKTITGAKKSRKNKKKKDKIINTINEGSDQEAVSKATAKKHKKETRRLKAIIGAEVDCLEKNMGEQSKK
ncbi:transcription initiation factor TFIID subunit 9-like [Scaptodrosophila lebanonensis]|uniref:Transcription initiation factor TFIID subunit 9-like n=1 Tax=Drosophila lebanonensis TaxID=7225 RepID=A0A6J2U378_DROLE|nr:transcription initiation factor TFIID subunit 9-like [Scaptodrosophila lebanonensis]